MTDTTTEDGAPWGYSWRPIETAPKGNENVDLVTDPSYIQPPKILLLFSKGEISVGYWDPYYATGGHGCSDGIAWIEPISGETLHSHLGLPIGWQPLPSSGEAVPSNTVAAVEAEREACARIVEADFSSWDLREDELTEYGKENRQRVIRIAAAIRARSQGEQK